MLVVRTTRERRPGVCPSDCWDRRRGKWGRRDLRLEVAVTWLIEHKWWRDVTSRNETRTAAAGTRRARGGLGRWEGGHGGLNRVREAERGKGRGSPGI